MKKLVGTVIWFDSAKGYGFLRPDGGEVFVHHSAVKMDSYKQIIKGQIVEFDLVHGLMGKEEARDVVIKSES